MVLDTLLLKKCLFAFDLNNDFRLIVPGEYDRKYGGDLWNDILCNDDVFSSCDIPENELECGVWEADLLITFTRFDYGANGTEYDVLFTISNHRKLYPVIGFWRKVLNYFNIK